MRKQTYLYGLGMTSQTWQFSDELKERGHHCPSEEVEDALLGLARDLLPESTAAKWDAEWAHALCKDALARLEERYAGLTAEEKYALDLCAQDAWDERVVAAGLDNSPAVFRRALKRWERSVIEAIERVQVNEGALS
jgi:hypothetical protein